MPPLSDLVILEDDGDLSVGGGVGGGGGACFR